MNPRDIVFPAGDYGLPTREAWTELRIWDIHYHGFNDPGGIRQHRQTMYYVERMGIERVISVDIASPRTDPLAPSPIEDEQRKVLEEDSQRVSGIIRIEPSFPEASCRKMEKWIRDGPCIGIKYAGFNKEGVRCSHPSNDVMIELARAWGAVVYIHTWMKVEGKAARYPGAGNNPGESTPQDVVALARRFPDVPLICGHSGGDWELAARVVRPYENVLFEFSGSDPHSGSVDYAVNELGVDRIVWGGHGPTRSYATELGKVLDADLSRADRMKVLGGNFRRISAGILRRKGQPIVV